LLRRIGRFIGSYVFYVSWLWVAREILSVSKSDAAKIMHGAIAPRKTWSDYCQDIGIEKSKVAEGA